MRIRTFSLALTAALAACQGNPAAPDPEASLNSALMGSGYRSESAMTPYVVGTGSRGGDASATGGSPAIGTGLRDGGDSASASSGFMSGGYRDGGTDGSVSASSTFMGGGARVGGDSAQTASSGYVGAGFRADEGEKDSPAMGGGGAE